MSAAAAFSVEALAVVQAQIERFRKELSFSDASNRPRAEAQDILVAGKESQLTIFRQTDLPFLNGGVLITVQIARFGLGGVVSFLTEKGLVFLPDSVPRDSTESELLASRVMS